MKNNKKVVRSLHLLPLRPTPSGITAVVYGAFHIASITMYEFWFANTKEF